MKCSTLVVALLLPAVAFARSGTDDKPAAVAVEESHSPAATVVVDLEPASGAPAWLASAFEQNITRELSGFERITTVVKEDLGAHTCGASRVCRLRAYRSANVDVVLFGEVTDGEISYELYQTWTPARLAAGTIETGRAQSPIGLKHATRNVFHPVLKHGGLLDQRQYSFQRSTPPAMTRSSGWSDAGLAIVGGLVLVLVLPFAILALRTREPRPIIKMRSARWVAAIIAASAFVVVALDPQAIGETVRSLPWVFAGLGGLALGAFLVVIVRAAFPALEGLERIPHQDLFRILSTWFLACAERLCLLAVLYAPFAWLMFWIGGQLAIAELWIFFLVAPAIGFIARLWFSSWIECLAVMLDRRFVDGFASRENPWSREINNYLMGYVRRTGWDLDPGLLASVIFLPGYNVGGVVSYGGGSTHARVVIDKRLLELAMGPLVEVKPDEKPALWPDWTTAALVPRQAARPRRSTTLADDFRGRKPSYPGVQRKPLGQAATLLGYVTPAPGQLVPLISDNPQDLAIVRELLSEHYPWFAPDPDDEYDATDPTDKDMLFGALARELGVVGRRETQLATVKLSLGARVAGITSRYRSRLADSYAAVNYARHHLIQYLYYRWTKDLEPLTARARSDRLAATSRRILEHVSTAPEETSRRLRPIRSRLAWLSWFFADPIVHRRRALMRRLAAAFVIAAMMVAAGFAVQRSLAYHPTYVKRVEAQERDLAESRNQRDESNPQKGSADGEAKED